jgi:hypothetical protein
MSPFNLIPPQLLIAELKRANYVVDYAKHDESEYIFTYKVASASTDATRRHLTVPIGNNNLFTMRSSEGYASFFKKAPSFDSNWCMFAGAANKIPDDLPRESTEDGIPREPAAPTNQPRPFDFRPDSIPYEDEDLEPAEAAPMKTAFELPTTINDEQTEDPAITAVKRKQSRLATIHEQLRHFSFHRLKLLAKAGLISRDLANVDPPTCPGCVYGKAHRKPWHWKGIKNRKHLKLATTSGQVVSVDQLVSLT